VIICDAHFSRLLERAEGRANAAFVETRERLFPEAGAAWIDVAGVYALPGSQSQKNAQKNGFDIAYTRTKWQLSR
jgi:hypothetical protein